MKPMKDNPNLKESLTGSEDGDLAQFVSHRILDLEIEEECVWAHMKSIDRHDDQLRDRLMINRLQQRCFKEKLRQLKSGVPEPKPREACDVSEIEL